MPSGQTVRSVLSKAPVCLQPELRCPRWLQPHLGGLTPDSLSLENYGEAKYENIGYL